MLIRSARPSIDIEDTTVHELLLASLIERGDAVAFVDAATGTPTSGFDAAIAAGRIASGLRGLGVKPGDVVCLAAPNSVEWALCFIGALSAGATVTTANPLIPAPALTSQLRLTGAQVIVTSGPLIGWAREATAGTAIRIVALDGSPGAAANLPELLAATADEPTPACSPGDLACLLTSSGTTGLPKAVMLTHHNLVSAIATAADMLGDLLDADPDPRFLGVLPYFHIAGLLSSLLTPVAEKCPVVIQPRFDLEELCRTVQDHRVTIAVVVPPIVLGLARHPAVDRYDLSSLRLLCSGAAPLGADLEMECAARLGCLVNQAYGMTEAVPISMSRPDRPGYRPGSVGTLVANTSVRIVDTESGQDSPLGQPGELWVRGPQVMAGYLGNPEATAECLTADGWLRTGDLCVVDDCGAITVIDRLKELIKVNAMQVAPAELEELLLSHPSVGDCAVVARPNDRTGEVPVAYVVPRRDEVIDVDAVKSFVASRVASYKRLAAVIVVDAIPKSPTGKILRRVLVERERELASVGGGRS
jgi:acyl-CoA synthetase (AMP-forming)/AMP-acid ligase II